jgi:hypothetical protein
MSNPGEIMTGTPNQIELAEQIKAQVASEFDRVTNAFLGVARQQNQHAG